MTESSEPRAPTRPPWVGEWFSPVLAAAFTVLWGLLIYALIGDRPTTWKYGTIPYVPAESVFTTSGVPKGKVPKQVVLPEVPGEAARENR